MRFRTVSRSLPRVCALLLALALGSSRTGLAQETPAPPPVPTDTHRPLATRAELQAAMEQAEQIANSDAYSAAFRADKRDEAALIRERLSEGDFYQGDQINLAFVGGDSGANGQHTVQFGRVLSLPGLPDIPLKGVLRSELQGYMAEQLGKYFKEPQVKARPLIRLTFLGGVGHAGFIQMDADILLSDALMQAGGIGNQTDLKRSKIRRGDTEILDGEGFNKAIIDGKTLDELNLRAGDEIDVGQKSNKDWFTTLRTFAVIPALIISTYGVGKLLGVF